MPTKRSVDDIKSKLLRPALTSHFEVEIPVIPGLSTPDSRGNSFLKYNGINISQNSDQQIKLNLLCAEASLPGSSLATLEINSDYPGVTERHAYRRIYDDRIDFTFYVDAENYLPIHFFETWIKYIADESIGEQESKGNVGATSPNYFYRMRYSNDYVASGLKIIKFERDYRSTLEYQFINAFPISISSMPVSYDSSSLLKCTVSMSYIRYILNKGSSEPVGTNNPTDPQQQAYFNSVDPSLQNPQFAVGGVPNFAANASANSIYTSDSEGPQSTLGRAFAGI